MSVHISATQWGWRIHTNPLDTVSLHAASIHRNYVAGPSVLQVTDFISIKRER